MTGFINYAITHARLTLATLAFLLLVLSALALSSCNTMQGAGEDVSAAGNALQRGAAEHNPEKQPAN